MAASDLKYILSPIVKYKSIWAYAPEAARTLEYCAASGSLDRFTCAAAYTARQQVSQCYFFSHKGLFGLSPDK